MGRYTVQQVFLVFFEGGEGHKFLPAFFFFLGGGSYD